MEPIHLFIHLLILLQHITFPLLQKWKKETFDTHMRRGGDPSVEATIKPLGVGVWGSRLTPMVKQGPTQEVTEYPATIKRRKMETRKADKEIAKGDAIGEKEAAVAATRSEEELHAEQWCTVRNPCFSPQKNKQHMINYNLSMR